MDREESNRSSLHSVTPAGKTPAERVMPPVVYQLRGMDEVTVHPNLRYSEWTIHFY